MFSEICACTVLGDSDVYALYIGEWDHISDSTVGGSMHSRTTFLLGGMNRDPPTGRQRRLDPLQPLNSVCQLLLVSELSTTHSGWCLLSSYGKINIPAVAEARHLSEADLA